MLELSLIKAEICSDDEIESAVRSHIMWMESAVYDIAAGQTEETIEAEVLADTMWNDPDTLQSLIGDFIPLEKGSWGTFRILAEFHEQGHKAIKDAAELCGEYWI